MVKGVRGAQFLAVVLKFKGLVELDTLEVTTGVQYRTVVSGRGYGDRYLGTRSGGSFMCRWAL